RALPPPPPCLFVFLPHPAPTAIYTLSLHDALPIYWVDRDAAWQAGCDLTDTMPWMVNRELAGAAVLLHDKVDGIVLLSSFSCGPDRKSTRLNSSHVSISYAVFCLKKKKKTMQSSRS